MLIKNIKHHQNSQQYQEKINTHFMENETEHFHVSFSYWSLRRFEISQQQCFCLYLAQFHAV